MSSIFSFRFTCCVGIFMFLSQDSLIAFKALLLNCIGLYVISLLKIIYSSPRPYWSDKHIETIKNGCLFDYPSPNNGIYFGFFFYAYLIFMYSVRYTVKVNKTLVIILYLILSGLMLTHLSVLFIIGLVYLHQIVISCFYSISFLIMCITFDEIILQLCE